MNEKGYIFRKLFLNSVAVWLPDEFQDLPEDIAAVKFPYKKMPSYIMWDKHNNAYITFDYFTKGLSINELDSAIFSLGMLMKQVYPYNKQIQVNNYTTVRDQPGRWFHYQYKTADQELYVELFIVSLYEKFFLGTLNCPTERKKSCISDFDRIRRQIHEVDAKDNG